MSYADDYKRQRQRCRTDLLWLCYDVLGYRDVREAVHRRLADSLQQFKGGTEIINDKGGTKFELLRASYKPFIDKWDLEGPRKTLILMPRGHLKTTIATIAYGIQWILNYPDIRILLSSATGDQVSGFLREMKSHFQVNETFRYYFPEFCPHKNVKEFGNQESFSVPNRGFTGKPGGIAKEYTVKTVSVGAVVASAHYDVVLNDDPVDKENVRTPEQIANVKSHLGYLWPLVETAPMSHKRPDGFRRGWWVVTGTPYDFSDTYASITDSENALPEGKKTYHMYRQSALISGELSEEPCKKQDCGKEGPHEIIDHAQVLWTSRMPARGLLEIAKDPLQGWGVLCTPAETPIIMGDWSDQPISTIKPGDIVAGFRNFNRGRHGAMMSMVPSTVKTVHTMVGLVWELTMSTGRKVRCTKDHRWFTGRRPSAKEPTRKMYAPAKIGTKLVNIVKPLPELTSEEQRWMDWLGGLIDGEGSCHGRNSIFISQSEDANPEVSAMIPKCLELLGIKWTQFNRPAGEYGGRKHQRTTQWMLRGGRAVMRQIATQARMAKRQRIIDSIYSRATKISEKNGGEHVVLDMKPVGFEQVYSLETETGNYVAWGFASSNSSQYLMNPVPPSSGLIASESELVWVPTDAIRKIYAYLSLHVTVDLAGMEPSTNKLADNDFTVINLHGFGHDGTLFVLSVLRGRFTPFEVIDLLFTTSALHPRLMDIKVEKEAHARVLLPFLKREMAKRGKWLPIVEIRRDNRTSKQQRIKGLQPWFRNGSIKFADNMPARLAIINEIMRFPKYAHDDILDTIADAMQGRDGSVAQDVVPMRNENTPPSMLGKSDSDMVYWKAAQFQAPNIFEPKRDSGETEYVGTLDPLTGF